MASDWGSSTVTGIVNDERARTRTRALFVYSLANRLPFDANTGWPLHTLFAFGRFTSHLEAAGSLLPRVLLAETLDDSALGPDQIVLAGLKIIVTITPRGDLTLVLEVVLTEDADAEVIVGLLAVTCFRRGELTVGNKPILAWVADHVDPDRRYLGSEALEFGRDVHQMVFPGGDLLGQIRSGHPGDHGKLASVAARIIYRGAVQVDAGVHAPEGLNNHGRTVVAHGRGVSVVAGWSPSVENVLAVTALTLVSALGVVQRTRRNAFGALSLNERAKFESTADARALVAQLSAELNDMQLDLSFGVEAYIDSVLIPELVLERFQSSLRDAVGLNDGLTNTSRMLERLHSVIQARSSTLEAALQEQEERRNRVFSAVVAVGSLFALPPALLLAFFGANGAEVDDKRSIFDQSHYWPAYLLAWLPFVILALIGYVLQRRIHVTSPQLSMHWKTGARLAGDGVDGLLPAQRVAKPELNRSPVRDS